MTPDAAAHVDVPAGVVLDERPPAAAGAERDVEELQACPCGARVYYLILTTRGPRCSPCVAAAGGPRAP